jgi:hypothetical protein
MNGTLGSTDMGESGFSFADAAVDLANDLADSLVIDASVHLDFAFGLDLNPMFNSSATSLWDRLPHPFIDINQFDISGVIGVNEWSTSIPFGEVDFAITEAKALLDISAALSASPIRINSPNELVSLVKPINTTGDRIVFEASLGVEFPVFLTYGGFGAGSRIKYQ